MKLVSAEVFRKLEVGTIYAQVVSPTVLSHLLVKESDDCGRPLMQMEQDSGYVSDQLKLVRVHRDEGYVPAQPVMRGFVKGNVNTVYAIFSSEELTGMIGFLAAGLALQLKAEGLTA